MASFQARYRAVPAPRQPIGKPLKPDEARDLVPSELPARAATTTLGLPWLDVGTEPVRRLRVQLPRADRWISAGEGGGVDLAVQLVRALPEMTLVAMIDRDHVDELRATLDRELGGDASRVRIVASDGPLSQWACDNGRPAWRNASRQEVVTILPAVANRSELPPVRVPWDDAIDTLLQREGIACVRSGLAFQGGNIMVIPGPGAGEITMLAGEAEIARNAVHGGADAVIEAFRATFGVTRVVVLPAVTFHIDFELSVRQMPSGLIAFVADPLAAALVLVRCVVDRVERLAPGAAAVVRRARPLIAPGAGVLNLLPLLGPVLADPAMARRVMSAGPGDHEGANLEAFLHAVDILAAQAPAGACAQETEIEAYLHLHRVQEQDRQMLHRQFESLGMKLVRVPTFSADGRAPNHLNGVQVPECYLMPAWGGALSPLDDVARRVFEKWLPRGVRVEPILCAETQRRGGAVRCSVAPC